MKRRIYFPLFVIFFQMIVAAGAQTPVLFSKSEQHSFVVHLQPGNDPAYQASNAIIRELARINNKRPDRTEYSFTFDVDVQLTRRGNKLVTRVDMDKFRFRGDYRYMGFDMSDVLLPYVDFKLELRQRGMLVTAFEQKATELEMKNNRFSFEYVDSLPNDNNLKMAFKELNLHITHINRRAFNAKTTLINDYFDTEAMLQDMYSLLQSIDVYELDYLNIHRQQLQDVEAGIGQIMSRDFLNLLQLNKYDPIAMVPKLNDIMALHSEVSQEMGWVLENLHVLYYHRGLEQLQYDSQAALNSFRESLRIMPEYAPAMVDMAKLIYNIDDDPFDAMQWVVQAWKLSYIDPQTRQSLQEFTFRITDDLQEMAREREDEGDYHQALENWIQVRDFCAAVRLVNCGNHVEEGIFRSHKGIYSGMIDDATRILARGELDQAERQIQKAIGYQRMNSRYIASAADADALMQDVKSRQYRKIIQDGRAHLQRQSFAMALNAFERALAIQRDYAVQQDSQLPELIKQSKRPLLFAELDRLSGVLQRNELEQARNILHSLSNDIQAYDFVADQEIASLMEEYREQLQGRHCASIEMHIESIMRRADQHIMAGEFLLADERFHEIIDLSNENSECVLSLQAMERRRAEVLPAINYQQRIIAVEEHIRAGRYVPAVDGYNDAGRFFEHNGLQKYRLEHKPIDEFSKVYHPGFVLHLANLFAHRGEASVALDLIYHLDSKDFSPRQMRDVQELTGRVLARNDAAENPKWKPRQKVKEYTHGNRSLRFMRRAYVKQFRRSR
jgi:tetratricopeptide (TPR) repeat protein